jgi:ribonuclease J
LQKKLEEKLNKSKTQHSKSNWKRKKKTEDKKHKNTHKHGKTEASKKPTSKMKVIPLGGLGEVGKNMTLFEYKNDIIIVDCGVKFPDESMYGIDLVLPDFTYVIENKDRVKGIVITHGHEDHIGGLPFLYKEIADVPLYATKLTMGLIENKFREHKLLNKVERKVVKPKDRIDLGAFNVEFIRTNHSIADSVALYIKSPVANVIHTGDFKVDFSPLDEEVIDLQRFASLGFRGVDLLMADSTNVELEGYTQSESSVGKTFVELFKGVKSRIIVATFASNVHRVQQIIDAAVTYNRKVVVSGRSMVNVTEVAQELGYLKIPNNVLIDIRDIEQYRDNEIVMITTGSQGEPMAALSRMSMGEHRQLQIKKGDLVILSASPIPGNEKMITDVIDRLYHLGAEVIYNRYAEIHVSGHARQEELKLIHTLVKPRAFIPVHGEYRMLMHHANLAESLGLPKKNAFVMENGDVLEIDQKSCSITGKVHAGITLVDGLGVGDIGQIVLNDRKRLSEDGLFIVVVTLKNGVTVSGPDIISRGFVYVRESEILMNGAKEEVIKALKQCEKNNIKEWNVIKNRVRDNLDRYLYKSTKRRPMILPILMEVK